MAISSRSWELTHPRQCETCPWKQGHDLSQIPNYDPEQHLNLKRTIAPSDDPAAQLADEGVMRVMACHHSAIGERRMCIGWLWHQITIGNNIPMRVRMSFCTNAEKLETFGPQVESFEETLV